MCKVLRTLCGTPRGYNIFSTSRIIQRLCFYENFEKGAVEFTGKILWVKKRLPVLVLSLLLMHVTGSHGADCPDRDVGDGLGTDSTATSGAFAACGLERLNF